MPGKYFLYPFQIGQTVTLKKAHPCGGKTWTILRVGLDVTLSCTSCSRKMILARKDLEKACVAVSDKDLTSS